MQDNQIKILLIEDNPGDVRLIQDIIKESGNTRYELSHADGLSSGMEFLTKSEYDVLLLDLGLPESQGLSTLNKILSLSLKLPIVVLTSLTDEMAGVMAVQKGIQDYLVKGRLDSNLLVHSIRYAIERKKLQDELVKSNEFLEQRVLERTSALERANKKLQLKIEELKQTRERIELLFHAIEQSPGIIVITDNKGNIEYVNLKFMQLTGYTYEEVIGKNPRILKSGKTPPEEYKQLWDTITSGGAWRGKFCNKKKNGELYWESSIISSVRNSEGIITNFIAINEDITELTAERKLMKEEQKKLRDQLYHVQKLESIGTLAGGVAHDFNNILSIIIGYGNLLEKSLGKGILSRIYIQKILKSAERATNLVQGLLAFSRKQGSCQKPAPINSILLPVKSLLSRLIGEDIVLDIVPAKKDCIVMADSGQMEQVLINLATNARDAMPNGGKLTIQADIVELGGEFIRTHGYGETGEYARISVFDTGVGMDKETQQRIFEPFFTTKEVGKGTGLGLSIVYGIIKQHGGYINVESKPGKGAAFRIYLPLIKSTVEEGKPTSLPAYLNGTETILVAEDEEEVRNLTKLLLEEAGYTVIAAVDGYDTINKFMENKDTINFLLLDAVMPTKNGREAYEEIRKIRPDIKALFMSGYSESFINKKIILKEGLYHISKPFSQTMLLKNVREILDNSAVSK